MLRQPSGKKRIPNLQISPIMYRPQINQLLRAIHLPIEVTVVHSKGHQWDSSLIARGNQLADQAVKQAASQGHLF